MTKLVKLGLALTLGATLAACGPAGKPAANPPRPAAPDETVLEPEDEDGKTTAERRFGLSRPQGGRLKTLAVGPNGNELDVTISMKRYHTEAAGERQRGQVKLEWYDTGTLTGSDLKLTLSRFGETAPVAVGRPRVAMTVPFGKLVRSATFATPYVTAPGTRWCVNITGKLDASTGYSHPAISEQVCEPEGTTSGPMVIGSGDRSTGSAKAGVALGPDAAYHRLDVRRSHAGPSARLAVSWEPSGVGTSPDLAVGGASFKLYRFGDATKAPLAALSPEPFTLAEGGSKSLTALSDTDLAKGSRLCADASFTLNNGTDPAENVTQTVCEEAAPPSPTAGHRHWRVLITDNGGDPNLVGVGNLELRATAGGTDQASGGTAWASSTLTADGGEHGPALAFDASTGFGTDGWVADIAPTSPESTRRLFPVALGYTFASPVSVAEYVVGVSTMLAPGGTTPAARSPRDLALQFSDDGKRWHTVDRRLNEVAWTASEQRAYGVAP